MCITILIKTKWNNRSNDFFSTVNFVFVILLYFSFNFSSLASTFKKNNKNKHYINRWQQPEEFRIFFSWYKQPQTTCEIWWHEPCKCQQAVVFWNEWIRSESSVLDQPEMAYLAHFTLKNHSILCWCFGKRRLAWVKSLW